MADQYVIVKREVNPPKPKPFYDDLAEATAQLQALQKEHADDASIVFELVKVTDGKSTTTLDVATVPVKPAG